MKPRSFFRLSRIRAWIMRREHAAWDMAVRTLSDHRVWRNRSDRWARLVSACDRCPRKGAA